MYEIIFYEDDNGKCEIADFLRELQRKSKSNKDSRVNLNKTIAYFDMLKEMGTRVGEPVTKHLEGEIWELRPLKNRFLYAYYNNDQFIVLHHFVKKSMKTPRKELETAKRKLKNYLERENKYGYMG